ncbi:redox-regulated ATPase YchF [Candidatus Micrarchaeota archaeon CG10_big_fil_rev_8_21_14_0_10_45_29]|nr:MAG: redox-regulated ATPase YchF [Candidatus Micrarchaeota archaeon CG10_big_fil_rev_8_21_14_0_10_45_29]
MQIGIVGAPNKGKSTFFASVTQAQVEIADYPFTTIDPNKGVAFIYSPCPCKELGLKCGARGGCADGMRKIPVQLLDVAGLVPGAHEGRGMGNKFLDDLSGAEGFVHIIDASGGTDLEGKPAQDFPLEEDKGFLKKEMEEWIFSILWRNLPKYKMREFSSLAEALSGLRFERSALLQAAKNAGMDVRRISGGEGELCALAKILCEEGKKIIWAANKADLPGALARVGAAGGEEAGIFACSANYELALQRAAAAGIVRYLPCEDDFAVVGKPEERQLQGLGKIREFMKKGGGTGVHKILHSLVFEKLGMIAVYPVEDEGKFSDSKGNVLPDVVLMKKGASAFELAGKIHTGIADKYVGAVDARTKRKISKDYALKHNDIIKIHASK